MRPSLVVGAFALLQGVAAQWAIWDLWTTTYDQSSLLTYSQPPNGIQFTSPGATGDVDIQVDDSSVYQTIYGFGAALTDSSALVLSGLKSTSPTKYWQLMDYLFNITDGANSGAFSYIRVPLGASDFSAKAYTYDDTTNNTADPNLTHFNISVAPSYLFSTLTDILTVNPQLRVHVVPWSPPAWMKNGTMDGGYIQPQYYNALANYLLKSLQGFKTKGIPIFAISIQNEPQYTNPTIPTTNVTAPAEAAIGKLLRPLMNSNGFADTKLIGYDHNWDNAATYPVQLMQQAGSSFDGVSFHCYKGWVEEQAYFTEKFPDKEVYFTECSGTFGSDWWSDIKDWMDNIMIGSVTYGASSGLMWNLALDPEGHPKLPDAASCGGPGCRGVVTVTNTTWSVNQEFYSLAQAAKAIIPRDSNGPWGQRIGVNVTGTGLTVGAYVTGRASSSDWNRYSLVVLNENDDSDNGGWNPQAVDATIEFRGTQATYTFPVGVTTLWWYAPAQ
ncbi:glycoside hydrolase family 30 protein [Coniophora puteana RWD-64-598 SS2]|uniref:Glycoside hydrolase family 30 protein n=1 Tax=Coniophora puteana (strain RWD-64-598) TaxID=741705 RepID=A0A5M3MC99_CONPW|nr:glycoside hydrolase family 30 protein [Coniophora puteana RWD-64-598 SS2]EIW76828.1 glycoside hydrolase family 30 protein [Coniophora puteana RWD-64-598 SS2]